MSLYWVLSRKWVPLVCSFSFAVLSCPSLCTKNVSVYHFSLSWQLPLLELSNLHSLLFDALICLFVCTLHWQAVCAPHLLTLFHCSDLPLHIPVGEFPLLSFFCYLIYAPLCALQLVSAPLSLDPSLLHFLSLFWLVSPTFSLACECTLLVYFPLLYWLVFSLHSLGSEWPLSSFPSSLSLVLPPSFLFRK